MAKKNKDDLKLAAASDVLMTSAEVGLSGSEKSSQVPAAMMADAMRAITRIKGKKVLLDIPTELAQGIASGELTRVGGVVRDSTGVIKGFLKDPSKSAKLLSKSATLAFIVIDITQTVLLNEKLAEIQAQLDRIENQVKALRDSKLHSALVEAVRLSLITKPADRRARVHSALTQISEAIPLLNSSLKSRLPILSEESHKAGPHGISFFGSKSNAREKCEKIVKEIREEIQFLASLFALRSRLEEDLQEYAAAAQSRAELTATVLAWNERIVEIFQEGAQINPGKVEVNFLHWPANILSFEGFDYPEKTTAFCSKVLAEADQLVTGTIRDYAIASAIARKPLPTYSD